MEIHEITSSKRIKKAIIFTTCRMGWLNVKLISVASDG